MELSPESTKVLYKNTTEYLHNIQNQIPNTMAVLKSYYALEQDVHDVASNYQKPTLPMLLNLNQKNPNSCGKFCVVTCNFCKKELVHNLCKPVKCPVDVNANKQTANNNKKRRKKKKDPFCGLQKGAVISTQLLKDDNKKIGNKTVENKILQRKVKKIQKKNIRKLKDTLNQLPSITTGNSLNNFLRSYEQIK
ncbi:uncharacterized protein BDFB_010475 [Asbolus verrucosus]|uniref:Uncharacterized protein n=1 Tax=Asbolus verrucosus TaxID=1661398 RepID=A0A482W0K2_ASBVE|nr:uncharacterized protein BDFB_010475 [Asbolus verrucosus]